MDNHTKVTITTRDRLLRAWENSMELTRDFECYAKEIQDNKKASAVFSTFAIEEGLHASKFRELLEEQG